jgi:hypothetical protein
LASGREVSHIHAPLKLQAADDRFSDLNAWVSANLAGSLTLQTRTHHRASIREPYDLPGDLGERNAYQLRLFAVRGDRRFGAGGSL